MLEEKTTKEKWTNTKCFDDNYSYIYTLARRLIDFTLLYRNFHDMRRYCMEHNLYRCCQQVGTVQRDTLGIRRGRPWLHYRSRHWKDNNLSLTCNRCFQRRKYLFLESRGL